MKTQKNARLIFVRRPEMAKQMTIHGLDAPRLASREVIGPVFDRWRSRPGRCVLQAGALAPDH